MQRYAAAIRAWRSYRGAPFATRVFLALRLLVLPLRALAQELGRLDGRVLGVGAGHGLLERWLAELDPRVEVEGIELDEERVAVAAATATRAPRVTIRSGDVRSLAASGAFDAAVAVDLIHHVPASDHAALATALAAALRPGGVLVVKDIARTPRWKHGFNSLHDRLVTGSWEGHTRQPEELAALLSAAGLTVERAARVAPLSPYPHYVVRARKPGR